MRWARLLGFFLAGLAVRVAGAEWTAMTWLGESAYESTAAGWRAVVSVARARLMHFGPAGADFNLLLAPPSAENRNRLGGHRLWLGPQAEWKNGWPPPEAWEYRAPSSVTVDGGTLRLVMEPTGDEWPQLTRTYRWDGTSLVCGAESSASGIRPAQFVHILQVRADLVVMATPAPPAERFPLGYVRLGTYVSPYAARFDPPPHAVRTGEHLALRHTGAILKLGFRPQPLTGRRGGYELSVSRGAQTGETAGEPDDGFLTQVYFSDADEAFSELEQLSPLFAAGKPARFEIVLAGRKL